MSATNIAFLKARKGHKQGLASALQELVGLSRRHPDCRLSHLHRSAEDLALWFLYEAWDSREALWAHLATAPVQSFARRAGPWLESDLGLRSFRLLEQESVGLAA